MITATEDMKHTSSSDVETTTELVWPYPIWAGQSQIVPFRLVNDSGAEKEITVTAEGERPERLLFSRRKNTDYEPSITVTARPDGMTDTLWVQITLPKDVETELVQSTIQANDDPITLEYNAYSTWNSQTDPYPRYSGDVTSKFLDTFQERGTVVTIARYDPLIDKTTLNSDGETLTERDLANDRRWVDPADPVFWQSPDTDPYREDLVIHAKVFLSVSNIDLPGPLTWGDEDLFYDDRIRILIPPDTFLDRVYAKWGKVVEWGPPLYQRTVYALLYDGKRYSIENVKPVFLQRGEFCYWQADCRLIFAPTTGNPRGWIPWNCLYETGKEPIVHYHNKFASSVKYLAIGYECEGS